MYAGWDKVRGFQLYDSDPSGNYASWKAHSTGKNSVTSVSSLKSDYAEGMTLKEGLALALKVLAKSMDTNNPDEKKFEIGVLEMGGNGKPVQRRIEGEELTKIIQETKVFEE